MQSKGQLDFLLILTFYKNKFTVKEVILERKQSDWDAQAFQFLCFAFVFFKKLVDVSHQVIRMYLALCEQRSSFAALTIEG